MPNRAMSSLALDRVAIDIVQFRGTETELLAVSRLASGNEKTNPSKLSADISRK